MDAFPLCHKVTQKPQTVSSRTGAFHPMPITAGCSASNVTGV